MRVILKLRTPAWMDGWIRRYSKAERQASMRAAALPVVYPHRRECDLCGTLTDGLLCSLCKAAFVDVARGQWDKELREDMRRRGLMLLQEDGRPLMRLGTEPEEGRGR